MRVVIDAGHGGKDPGCIGKLVREKDVALGITLALGRMLEEAYPDVEVLYTRDSDVFVPLHERARIANKAEADLFISVHANSVARRNSAYGTETFVLGLHRAEDNLEVAKRENAVILMEDDYQEHYDGYDPNSPEGHILLSMYQNAFLEQSIALAHRIEEQFKHKIKRHSRGVKQAGFLVLRNTTMPSVLVEAGFLSHDDEEAYLAREEGQQDIAASIFAAFAEYKAAVEQPAQVVSSKTRTLPDKERPAYYVQLAASSQPLDTSTTAWQACGRLQTKQEDNYYKYLAGPFSTLAKATQQQKRLREAGFAGAFVVAYQKNKRISVNEAQSLARQ
ncbi:MAG: N-acetylmuramoyl-L-alanine amidase [Saprospiraceae bacterium]|nr:N-acetylmuramoyl-L-alanine amidase [Saprospiraceae bacterium]